MKRFIVSIVIGFVLCGCAWGAAVEENNETPTDAGIANGIINNLRELQVAGMLFREDNNGQLPADITPLMEYVAFPTDFPEGHYLVEVVNDYGYIGFSFKNAATSDGVKEKISERAERNALKSSPDVNGEKYTNQDVVWMMGWQK